MIYEQKIYYVLDSGRLAYMDYDCAERYARRFKCIITDKDGNILEDFTDDKNQNDRDSSELDLFI